MAVENNTLQRAPRDVSAELLQRYRDQGAVSRPGTPPQEFTPRDPEEVDRNADEILLKLGSKRLDMIGQSDEFTSSKLPTASTGITIDRRVQLWNWLATGAHGEMGPKNDEERALTEEMAKEAGEFSEQSTRLHRLSGPPILLD